MTIPPTIMVLVWAGIVRGDHLTVETMAVRAGIAFGIEFIVNFAKLRVDAVFGVWDHLVVNRMGAWDVGNIGTTGLLSENLFLFAIVYVITM